MIDALIDKQDYYELIRNNVAQILADEVENQKTRAVAAGEDPGLWDFKVYAEHSNPFELIEEVSGIVGGDSGVANVWYDASSLNGGNTISEQNYDTRIIIDCCSAKAAKDNPDGGITLAADVRASYDSERIARLVRNILMSAEYHQLGMSGIVGKRIVERIEKLQPDTEDRPAQRLMVTRITLVVSHIEESPQVEPETLEAVVGELQYSPTGEILASVEFDYKEDT